jgi:DNA topoisomerase III
VIVVVAEKPSVARDIARVLGARERMDGALRGSGYLVTWAIGHLVALAQPEQIDPRWKGWRFDTLPMLPRQWPLAVLENTRKQFALVSGWLTAPETREVVCATDAGREGELIFRYIAEQARLQKPVKRLWVSSLTDEAIRAGFRKLQDASVYDPLADAARGRSRADWLVGMNLSRAYTLLGERGSGVLSVGRVQTPTLALLVERDRAIAAFVPEAYQEVAIDCAAQEKTFEARYVRSHQDNEAARLDPKTAEAAEVRERALTGEARVHAVEREEKRSRPQLLYDLTELQRHASRLYGFSASHTLEVAQRLYEQHKLISYPRTDSRHLSDDVARELPAIIEAVTPPYRQLLEPDSLRRTLGKRFVDDSQVRDHHAIIPTGKQARLAPGSDDFKLYDLIVRRLLAAYQSDYVWAVTTVRIEVALARPEPPPEAASGAEVDRYLATGNTMLQLGYRALDVLARKRDNAEAPSLPALSEGAILAVKDARVEDKQTRPPPHFSEASLLTAMETAGRALDDKELSEAMRERGLGTPATRAATIETLLARGFIVRDDKSLRSTPTGMALIDAVHPQVRSPAMTGEWEYKLREIERGRGKLDSFMAGIEAFVAELIASMGGGTRPASTPARSAMSPAAPGPEYARSAGPRDSNLVAQRVAAPRVVEARAPTAVALRAPLDQVLKERFGFAEFRPHQRVICEHLVAGRDVLVVMPTGAGKSLCYQLPGIARAGTTLVVSPLIALIEDQTAKLNKAGMRAERIHSGLGREAARETCRAYLRGELDFLFIAPERLRVPGFTELLERRPPALIAIDEAHCISQWGHDFRPDYRLLRERLPTRGAGPIVALTATATRAVQRDIVDQLGMPQAVCSIHGFRRHNLAIHVLDAQPRERAGMAAELLAQRGRLPAILYAPTRAIAEQTAGELGSDGSSGASKPVRSAAYHAGMDASARDRVQRAFLAGELDVVVATVAFGMGVDKADVRTVVHLASASSVEAYYQEIGRAGRDGKPSLAMLLCSPADRRTHQFFFERDYPVVSELERVFVQLGDQPVWKGTLARSLKLEDNALDAILDKLWLHGGARVDHEEQVVRGSADFRRSYPKHRASKAAQLAHMERFLDTRDCRMLALLAHFGDSEDAGARCGICDRCRPDQAPLRTPSNVVSRGLEPTRTRVRRSRVQAEPEVPAQLLAALRAFRRDEARARGIPPFRVLSDRALLSLAAERPGSEDQLRAVSGVGPALAKKYGARLLRILREV